MCFSCLCFFERRDTISKVFYLECKSKLKRMGYLNSDYDQQIKNIRGEIIDRSIFLERLIDIYIATYFCGNWTKKTSELLELIIATNRMIWENKIQVFKILLERHSPNFLVENPKIINGILGVIVHRNVFAHYIIHYGEKAKLKFDADKTITLIKFKNSVEYVTYSEIEIDKIISDIRDYTIAIGELVNINDVSKNVGA